MNRRSNQTGFAMVEVLSAMVVLTVLAVGVLAGERGGHDSLRRGLDETRVLWAIQEHLDRARAMSVDLAVGTRHLDLPALPGASLTEETVLVEPGLLSVRIAIRWPGTAGGELRRETVTWVAREEGR